MNKNLFADYFNWMVAQGWKTTVANTYISKFRSLLRELNKNGYSAMINAEDLLGSAQGNKTFMDGLLSGIDQAIASAFSDPACPVSKRLLNDGRSSFRKFVQFIAMPAAITNPTSNSIVTVPAVASKVKTVSRPLAKMMGWQSFSSKDIKRIIFSRLRSQDRITGNKTWLLMRLVIKLLGADWFSEWASEIYAHTKVVTGPSEDNFVTLDKVSRLELRPAKNGSGNEVFVYLIDGSVPQVYTRTNEGGYAHMVVANLDEISLDHVKPIDQSLRDLSSRGCLPLLDKITIYLNKTKQKGQNANDLMKAVLKKYPQEINDIDKGHLAEEMKSIRSDTDYELMEKNANVRKGKR